MSAMSAQWGISRPFQLRNEATSFATRELYLSNVARTYSKTSGGFSGRCTLHYKMYTANFKIQILNFFL